MPFQQRFKVYDQLKALSKNAQQCCKKVRKQMLKQVKILSPACIFFTLLFLNGCSGQIASLYSDNNKETLISSNENSLKEYYAQLEKKKLSMGLLRQDAGGSDTPFDEEDIIAAFEQLAFYNEYQVNENQLLPSSEPVSLGKWNSEINISTRFGDSVNFEQKRNDLKEINELLAVLSRVSKHKMRISENDVNMFVIVGNQKEIVNLTGEIGKQLFEFDPKRIPIVAQLPKEIHCMAMTSVSSHKNSEIESALVIIRNELPKVMRKACFHEEISQTLGLTNDSHLARPSIFNDNDEFATLTEFDKILIKILYDRRLKTGISRKEASRLVKQIVNEIGA